MSEVDLHGASYRGINMNRRMKVTHSRDHVKRTTLFDLVHYEKKQIPAKYARCVRGYGAIA